MKQIHFIGLDSNNHLEPVLTAELLAKLRTMYQTEFDDEQTSPFLLATWFGSDVRTTYDMANINIEGASELRDLLQQAEIETSFQGYSFFNNFFASNDDTDEDHFFSQLNIFETVAAEARYAFKQCSPNELTRLFSTNKLTPIEPLKPLQTCITENHTDTGLEFLALQDKKYAAIAKKIAERAEAYNPLFVMGPIADILPLVKLQKVSYTVEFLCSDMEQAIFNAQNQLLVRQLLPQMILAQKATAQ